MWKQEVLRGCGCSSQPQQWDSSSEEALSVWSCLGSCDGVQAPGEQQQPSCSHVGVVILWPLSKLMAKQFQGP